MRKCYSVCRSWIDEKVLSLITRLFSFCLRIETEITPGAEFFDTEDLFIIQSLMNNIFIFEWQKQFSSSYDKAKNDYVFPLWGNCVFGDRTKWYWTKRHEQNGTDKMVATFIDSNSTELNFYSVITSHK